MRKFILDEWLKNCNVPINSLTKKNKVQRKPVSPIIKLWGEVCRLERKLRIRERGLPSLKLDQKVIRGIDVNSKYSAQNIKKKTGVSEPTIQEVKKRYGYKTYRKQKFSGRS